MTAEDTAAQSAIEVVDQRTRSMQVIGEIGDRGLHAMKSALELTVKLRCLAPDTLGLWVKGTKAQTAFWPRPRDVVLNSGGF
jgi:hypothetical protein